MKLTWTSKIKFCEFLLTLFDFLSFAEAAAAAAEAAALDDDEEGESKSFISLTRTSSLVDLDKWPNHMVLEQT